MPRASTPKVVRRESAHRAARRKAVQTRSRTIVRMIAYSPRWRRIATVRILKGIGRCVGLTVERQQQTQWCWAAVSNSVSHFYNAGSTWSQCTIVNAELGRTNCCTSGSSSACNKSWYLDRALRRVGCLLTWASGTLSFATVRSLLGAGRPPCARQGWSGGGGHFMAIVCVFEGVVGALSGAGSTAKRVKISDPWYGDSIVDYTTFVSGYQGSGSWTHSYRTQP